jgi:hypothetical protein
LSPPTRPTNGATTPPVPPEMGTFQAVKSKYYGNQVMDPVSGAHYDADSLKTTDEPVVPIEKEDVNELRQLGIYAGILLLIVAVAAGVGSAMPGAYLPTLGVATFIAGVLLPVLRVAPFGSDDSSDLAIALALILILGPFAGAIFYGVICFMRQDFNPAIIGVFVSYLLIRIGLDVATGHSVAELFSKMLPDMNFANFAARWMPLAGIVGWYVGDVFKKPDE